MNVELRKVNMEHFLNFPNRYKLVSGDSEGAPLCSYGNHYEWIGFDQENREYVRLTKSVFKILIGKMNLLD